MKIGDLGSNCSISQPATDREINLAEVALKRSLSEQHKRLLKMSNGIVERSGIVLYSTTDLPERNGTFEVATYAPGFVAIGDDSGGRLFLVDDTGADESVYVVDQGSVSKGSFSECAASIAQFVEEGFAGARESQSCEEIPDCVDVFLERDPPGGLKDLLKIKQGLGLEMGLAELKGKLANTPARILANVPYGKFKARCRRINAETNCLGLRTPDGAKLNLD
jgi:hypothetical protein